MRYQIGRALGHVCPNLLPLSPSKGLSCEWSGVAEV